MDLLESTQCAVILYEWDEASSGPLQRGPLVMKQGSVFGLELRPGNGVDETSRAELIRAEHILDKNADWTGKRMERVMERDDAFRN